MKKIRKIYNYIEQYIAEHAYLDNIIIVGLICGTILWVFTSSLKKDNSPIMEGASIEEYEQQMFEEIPEEKEPPKKEESPIDFKL